MTKEDIKKLSPVERVAGYLVRTARIAEVGAKLRTKHPADEDWTEEGWKEWDEATDATDNWFYALSEEEKKVVQPVYLFLGCLTRGEYPPP